MGTYLSPAGLDIAKKAKMPLADLPKSLEVFAPGFAFESTYETFLRRTFWIKKAQDPENRHACHVVMTAWSTIRSSVRPRIRSRNAEKQL